MPKITASTQDHVDIADIKDNIVLLRNSSAVIVLETTSVNFDLLSEREQDAAIYAYAGLLNSLTFPLQIVIRSRRTDVSIYLDKLAAEEEKQKNPDLRAQIKKYRHFLSEIVQKNQVLDKRFYLVIPFLPAELGIRGVTKIAQGKKSPFSTEYVLEQAKTTLYPKRDQILKQLSRIGLKAFQLTSQQLIELFYDIYNPGQISTQKLIPQTGSYTTVFVEPALAEGPGGGEEKPPPPPPPLEPRATAPGQLTAATQAFAPPPVSAPQPPATDLAVPPNAEPPPQKPALQFGTTPQAQNVATNVSGTIDEKYQKMLSELQSISARAGEGKKS